MVAIATLSPGAEGLQIMKDNGCVACHTSDGTRLVGPSYKGVFGHTVEVITNGKKQTITVDEEYIKRSILHPDEDVVVGFNKGLMRSYQGQISDQEIDKIIEYLKSLSQN